MTSRLDAEIAIVGAGITGLFAALHLARRGRRVIVLERGRAMAEASGVNAGSLGVQNKLLPLVPFALSAIEEWRAMPTLLGDDAGFVNAGGWRVAQTATDREFLSRSAAAQSDAGVPLTWFDANELRVRAPHLGPSVVAATFSPVDSYGSPLRLAHILRSAVIDAGVDIHEATTVKGLAAGSSWHVDLGSRELRADAVLVAAGPWSGRLLDTLGVYLPFLLDVNMVSVTEPAPRVIDGIVFHARGILTVKQVRNGTCLIGGGWQGTGDLETGANDIDYQSMLHNIRLAASVLPALAGLNIVRQWAGFEAVTPDALPYLGAVPSHEGLFVAAGTRGGWTLGPVVGRLAAELIADGATSRDVAAFNPGRVMAAAAHV